MNKISYYYLELIKIILTSIVLFALFGSINDIIIKLISGYTFPDMSFLKGHSKLMLFFLLQYLGFGLIVLVLYKNIIQFIGFKKQKTGRKLTDSWTKKLSFFSIILIVLFYIVLLFY
ncbi:hypothetical protein [Niallia sp. 03133]|uniref:hypothetical protein n=1 Tax=Niallia sp. 03133 TaxID=3458060 RepID=UPI004043CA56